jgi:hypothetical protein
MSPFCRGATTAGDHVCDLDVVAVKRDGAHSKVEVAVVDERSILGRFAIKFRGSGSLGSLRGSGRARRESTRRHRGGLPQLSHEFTKLDDLLLELSVGDHRFGSQAYRLSTKKGGDDEKREYGFGRRRSGRYDL